MFDPMIDWLRATIAADPGRAWLVVYGVPGLAVTAVFFWWAVQDVEACRKREEAAGRQYQEPVMGMLGAVILVAAAWPAFVGAVVLYHLWALLSRLVHAARPAG